MKPDCSRAQDLIVRSLSGNASGADERELKGHLASCAACAESRDRLSRVWDLMGRVPRVALSEEQAIAVARRVRSGGAPARPVPSSAPAGSHARWAAVGFAAAVLLGVVVYLALASTRPPVVPRPDDRGTAQTAPPAPPATEPERSDPEEPGQEMRESAALAQAVLEAIEDPEVAEPEPPPAPDPEPVVTPTPVPDATPPEKPAPPAPPVVERPAPVDPPKPTVSFIALLERASGRVEVLSGSDRGPASDGLKLQAGYGLETVGRDSQAVVVHDDGTRLVLGGDTSLGRVEDERTIHLDYGVLACSIARQPRGSSVTIHTPHGDAVAGSARLTLTVTSRSTLLEVERGRVRLTDRAGKSVDVSSRRYAVAAEGIPLAARARTGPRVALRETFSRRWSQLWSQEAASGNSPRFRVSDGTLVLRFPMTAPSEVPPGGFKTGDGSTLPPDVGRKLTETVLASGIDSRAEWPRATWLETRQAFPLHRELPLRIRVRLRQSAQSESRIAWVCLNRKDPKTHLAVKRQGARLQLWTGEAKAPVWEAELPCGGASEALELWLTPAQVILRRNDETVHSGPLPTGARAFRVALGGGAKLALPGDEELRFDDVEVAWMSAADLARILK